MKTLGNIVSPIVYGSNVHKDAANVLNECRTQCLIDLERLGITQERGRVLAEQAQTRFLATCHLCESPIEQMMLAAMSMMVMAGTDCFPPAIHDVMSGEQWPVSPVVIAPQFVIARYRLDFLVSVQTKDGHYHFAVECDGAQHHSNQRDIARDEARDTYLQRLNIFTYRVSGSWIYKHGWRIADELAHICLQKRTAA
jgi:very-short-patch-repair endonuclease